MKKRRRFTDQFKADAIALVENGGSVEEVARDLDIETSCLYAWRRKANAQSENLGSEGQRAVGELPGADEVLGLRREIDRLQRENFILKKAAVILGTDSQPSVTKLS